MLQEGVGPSGGTLPILKKVTLNESSQGNSISWPINYVWWGKSSNLLLQRPAFYISLLAIQVGTDTCGKLIT